MPSEQKQQEIIKFIKSLNLKGKAGDEEFKKRVDSLEKNLIAGNVVNAVTNWNQVVSWVQESPKYTPTEWQEISNLRVSFANLLTGNTQQTSNVPKPGKQSLRDIINDQDALINELEEQIELEKSANGILTTQLEQAKKDRQILTDGNARLQGQLSTAQSALRDKDSEIRRLQESIGSLRKSTDSTIAKQKDDIKELKAQVQELQARLQQSELANKGLRGENAELQGRNKDLTAGNAKLQEQLSQIQSELQSKDEQLVVQATQLRQLESANQELTSGNAQKDRTISSMETRNRELQEKINELQASLSGGDQERQRQIEALQQQKDTLSSQNADLQGEKRELSAAKLAAESQVAALTAQLEKQKREFESSLQQETEKHALELAEQTSQNADLTTKVREQAKSIDSLTQETLGLSEEKVQLEEKLSKATAEIASVKSQISQLQERLLMQENDRDGLLQKERSEHGEKLSEQGKVIELLRSKVEEQAKDLGVKDAEIKTLKDQREAMSMTTGSREQEYEDRIAELQRNLSDLSGQLQKQKEEMEILEKVSLDKYAELDEHQAKISELEGANAAQLAKMSELEKANAAQLAEIGKLTGLLEKEQADHSKDSKVSEKQLKAKDKTIKELQVKLAAVEEQLALLQESENDKFTQTDNLPEPKGNAITDSAVPVTPPAMVLEGGIELSLVEEDHGMLAQFGKEEKAFAAPLASGRKPIVGFMPAEKEGEVSRAYIEEENMKERLKALGLGRLMEASGTIKVG